MRKFGEYKRIGSWKDLIDTAAEFHRSSGEWVFRGESVRRAPKTSLQRVCEEFDIRTSDIPRLEAMLLQDFRRHASVYSPALTQENNTIFLLSLMRHYGAPTRLLDFTYSFFVAVFFALERPAEKKEESQVGGRGRYEPAAVWAISKSWLTNHSVRFMKRIGGLRLCKAWGERKSEAFERLFWDQRPPKKCVFAVNPYRSHERLRIQQGVFLCPGDVSVSFEENLLAIPGHQDNVRLMLIESDCRREVLANLYATGVHRGSMFPGLDGFASSLCTVTPLLFLKFAKFEKQGTRVPMGRHGEFLWAKYLARQKEQPGR